MQAGRDPVLMDIGVLRADDVKPTDVWSMGPLKEIENTQEDMSLRVLYLDQLIPT